MRRILALSSFAVLLSACGAVTVPPTSLPPALNPPSLTAEPVAALAFNPATLTLAAGETKEVQVTLDLKQLSSRAYEARIQYDPAVVEIVDADSSTSGTQVALDRFVNSADNNVDAKTGKISIVAYNLEPIAGTGAIMKFTIKGKKVGTTTFTFVREPKNQTQVILDDPTSTDILATTGTLVVTVQ